MDTFDLLETFILSDSESESSSCMVITDIPSSAEQDADVFDLPINHERDVPGGTFRGWCIIS
uniref:Pheromone phb3.1 n=1 Tax=Pleurotus eryngii var. eryngii TaxID=280321 RepID=X2DEJ1_PLEER|nr:pheromone phb3.1 [Pleurotus eryngii var. eryngii]